MEEGLPVTSGKKEKGRVRFNSTAGNEPPALELPVPSPTMNDEATLSWPLSPLKKPRPSIIRGSSYNSVLDGPADDDLSPDKLQSAVAAHQRAQAVAAAMLGSYSAPTSRRGSADSNFSEYSGGGLLPPAMPLQTFGIESPEPEKAAGVDTTSDQRNHNAAAYDLVRAHTQAPGEHSMPGTPELRRVSAHSAPLIDLIDLQDPEMEYGPNAGKPREGLLGNLLKLYRVNEMPQNRKDFSGYTTPGSSGSATPTRRKWYDQDKNSSQNTLASLAAASAILANPNERRSQGGAGGVGGGVGGRPKHKRTHSSKIMSMIGGKPRMEEEARITIHVATILKKQEFIIKLCRALMQFGAPTHRLEEYLRMMARVLEIDAQFLYLPGCMFVSFDDRSTHTTEVKIVRIAQGVNLGKLKDVHEIYKEVLHDVIPLDEAVVRLEDTIRAPDRFQGWARVLMYGLASATVAPFAFSGRPIDMPICFLTGSLIGVMQLVVAPLSDVYSNVFEICAAVVTSFLARMFGSLQGGDLFCFSAIAQSSIALILPGYLVLCSALELQSKAIVPGSIRMVYAIIYSLFLGFGITIGAAIYGWMDSNATSSTTCNNTINPYWNFAFVPVFAMCLTYVNQAKWSQMPVMILIALIGYIVNFFTSLRFPNSAQISNTLGALAVGVAANLYSRLRHGVAAAAILPAIFVQVPSGLAASGSLVSGLTSANTLTNSTSTVNGTTTSTITSSSSSSIDAVVFNVAASMIQIAVGITVGLFFATLLIYPMGKRRSGLFTL